MKKVLLVLALGLSSSVYASCSDLYAPNSEPNVKVGTELCNSFYVSRFDTRYNAVRYVSEKLVGSDVGSQKRVNAFKADARVKGSPTPSNYSNSGYDKGHMVPADDASTPDEMRSTFLMTNMTPQVPSLNQQAWRLLEDKVRNIHLSDPSTPTYVETIPTYLGNVQLVGGKVPVPSGYWKLVSKGSGKRAFYADNVVSGKVKEVSYVDPGKLLKAQKF